MIRRLLRWEARTFLGEQDIKLVLKQSPEHFVGALLNRVDPAPRRLFLNPLGFRDTAKPHGYIKNDIIIIKLHSKRWALSNFLGMAATAYFSGKIRRRGNEFVLEGAYGWSWFYRYFLLVIVNMSLALPIISLIDLALTPSNAETYFAFFALVGVISVIVVGISLVGKLFERSTRREWQKIYEILNNAAQITKNTRDMV